MISILIASMILMSIILLINKSTIARNSTFSHVIDESISSTYLKSAYELARLDAASLMTNGGASRPSDRHQDGSSTIRSIGSNRYSVELRFILSFPDLYDSPSDQFAELELNYRQIAEARSRVIAKRNALMRYATIEQTLAQFDLPAGLAEQVTQRHGILQAAESGTNTLIRVKISKRE